MKFYLQDTGHGAIVKWIIKSERSHQPLIEADTKEELIAKLPEFMKGKDKGSEVWEWYNGKWVQHWPK